MGVTVAHCNCKCGILLILVTLLLWHLPSVCRRKVPLQDILWLFLQLARRNPFAQTVTFLALLCMLIIPR